MRRLSLVTVFLLTFFPLLQGRATESQAPITTRSTIEGTSFISGSTSQGSQYDPFSEPAVPVRMMP